MCLHQRRQDGTGWMDLMYRNTTQMAGLSRVLFPSNPITSWCLHKRLKFLLVYFLLCPPQLILRNNEIAAIIWEDCLYFPCSSNQVPQCKYEWISVKGKSNLNVYCSTTHTGEHCSIVLDLTPFQFYYERAKHVHSTECEWWSLSNSTRGGLPFNQLSMQPAALYTMEDHLLNFCIPTYHPVTTAS